MDNPFKVLGLSSSASMEEVKSAYKRLCKVYHPDNISTGNDAKFLEVNKAYKDITSGKWGDLKPKKGGAYMWRHKSLFNIYKEEMN